MPKLVRREPLIERIKAYLDPLDFLLWLSEEIDSNGWDQLEKEWAVPIGIGLNLLFVTARSNSRPTSRGYDEVFGDARRISWFAWLATFIVHVLVVFSVLNAVYTFWRRRHYRLFENDIDAVPSTPSAHRVRVDSSPVSSSPLQFLSSMLGRDNAQSRAHPDRTRDVWELAVWDPLPVCLRLFCYFSPGHVLVYWFFLPVSPADARPSTTIATSIFIAILLSIQLSFLQSTFSQQGKDSALISKEVLHEYDKKYVHPRTQPMYRDVGTQFSEQASYSALRDAQYNVVETYKPTIIINRGFTTNPNPNYIQHTDPDGATIRPAVPRQPLSTPSYVSGAQVLRTPAHLRDSSSPLRPNTAIRQPVFQPGASTGDGGSLGVYSHAASPLRKSASTNFSARTAQSHDYAKEKSPEKRPSSPNKRMSVPSNGRQPLANGSLYGHLKPDRSRRESGRF